MVVGVRYHVLRTRCRVVRSTRHRPNHCVSSWSRREKRVPGGRVFRRPIRSSDCRCSALTGRSARLHRPDPHRSTVCHARAVSRSSPHVGGASDDGADRSLTPILTADRIDRSTDRTPVEGVLNRTVSSLGRSGGPLTVRALGGARTAPRRGAARPTDTHGSRPPLSGPGPRETDITNTDTAG